MAYSTRTDWELAAGGIEYLAELADLAGTSGDRWALDSVALWNLSQKAAEIDAWINSYAVRIQAKVPFDPVPPMITMLAAEELIYRFKVARRVAGEDDHQRHAERVEWLRDMANGRVNPVEADVYPIGESGIAPVAVERSSGTDDEDPFARDGFRGFV